METCRRIFFEVGGRSAGASYCLLKTEDCRLNAPKGRDIHNRRQAQRSLRKKNACAFRAVHCPCIAESRCAARVAGQFLSPCCVTLRSTCMGL
ncbi:MAG: hypothetical protein LBU42_09855 [Prevotellaceae bacterium]|nr:hypothetical protein [Prevotellaceae bacterium]